MNIGKDDFINVARRMRIQFERDRTAQGCVPDADIWIAAIRLLSLAIGESDDRLVNRWIYENECGRYPDEEIPARTAEELWELLEKRT